MGEKVLKRSNYHHGQQELLYSPQHTIRAVTACAGRIAAKAGLPPLNNQPGLMVTDNSTMRRAVAAGQSKLWTAHSATVVHIHTQGMSKRSHEDMWVDMMMLSMADCFVTSRSGFSRSALWMSNATCYVEMLDCQREHDQL